MYGSVDPDHQTPHSVESDLDLDCYNGLFVSIRVIMVYNISTCNWYLLVLVIFLPIFKIVTEKMKDVFILFSEV